MKFTYYTIIGKNPELLQGHIENTKFHAGFDRLSCEKEFICIVYTNPSIPKETTSKILDICKKYDVRSVLFEEKTNNFLHNLYSCWNLGYEASDDGWVFRSGSDEFHNFDSLIKIYDIANNLYKLGQTKILYNCNTIEHSIRAAGKSRHLMANFGDTFQDFNVYEFENYVKKLNENVDKELLSINDCIKYWNKPDVFRSLYYGPGHNRTEGTSWLITKEDWLKHGPMNLGVVDGWATGDMVFHDILEHNGYRDYAVRDAVAFHLFRGESFERY